MKLLLEQIDVDCHADTTPNVICWRGGMYSIETIIDRWSTRGPWWTTDEQRDYILVATSCGVMEIFHSSLKGWILSRVFD